VPEDTLTLAAIQQTRGLSGLAIYSWLRRFRRGEGLQPLIRPASPATFSRKGRKNSARLGPPNGDHVVHLVVAALAPLAGQRIERDAERPVGLHPFAFEKGFQLQRLQELPPVVSAGRQPAQHVFGAELGQRQRLQGAVE